MFFVFFRVESLLVWLSDSARKAVDRRSTNRAMFFQGTSPPSISSPAPVHIQCVAAILWQCHETQVDYDLVDLITPNLVR